MYAYAPGVFKIQGNSCLSFAYIADMTKKTDLIRIFAFGDYRTFLEAYYSSKKAMNRHFSYRSFAATAGVAPSVLRDIMAGRRNLTLSVMQKYAEAMKMGRKERRYFELLVMFEQASATSEKNRLFGEMLRLRGQVGMRLLEENHYEFFSEWYHSIIREMVTLPDFVESIEQIAQRISPPITPAQAKASIELLLRIGILKRDAQGRLMQSDAVISSDYEMASSILRSFHGRMISLAARALEEIPREKREISSLTLAVSGENYGRIKERIRAFKEELLAMVVEDAVPSQMICQLNFQLFPFVGEVPGVIDDASDDALPLAEEKC